MSDASTTPVPDEPDTDEEATEEEPDDNGGEKPETPELPPIDADTVDYPDGSVPNGGE